MGRVRATRIASTIGQVLAVLFVVTLYRTGYLSPIHVFLAAFIFYAARTEEAHVLYEERRRLAVQAAMHGKGNVAVAPGYHWVDRGKGFWQLAPMGVGFPDLAFARDQTAWR